MKNNLKVAAILVALLVGGTTFVVAVSTIPLATGAMGTIVLPNLSTSTGSLWSSKTRIYAVILWCNIVGTDFPMHLFASDTQTSTFTVGENIDKFMMSVRIENIYASTEEEAITHTWVWMNIDYNGSEVWSSTFTNERSLDSAIYDSENGCWHVAKWSDDPSNLILSGFAYSYVITTQYSIIVS